jgi:hypothetical protein
VGKAKKPTRSTYLICNSSGLNAFCGGWAKQSTHLPIPNKFTRLDNLTRSISLGTRLTQRLHLNPNMSGFSPPKWLSEKEEQTGGHSSWQRRASKAESSVGYPGKNFFYHYKKWRSTRFECSLQGVVCATQPECCFVCGEVIVEASETGVGEQELFSDGEH